MYFELIHGDGTDPASYRPLLERAEPKIWLFDPAFYAKKKAYRQIRKKNKVQLRPIQIPKNYEAYWRKTCEIAESFIGPHGWFIYKADIWTVLKTFPITQEYFKFIADTIWDKVRLGTGYYIRKQHEYILLWCLLMGKNLYTLQRPRKQQLKSRTHGSSRGKAFKSVQRLLNSNGGEFGRGPRSHINSTEWELWYGYIRYFTPPNAIIVDPAMGSGSIGEAAKYLGRGYHGIEIDQEEFENAETRLASVKYGTSRIENYFTNLTKPSSDPEGDLEDPDLMTEEEWEDLKLAEEEIAYMEHSEEKHVASE